MVPIGTLAVMLTGKVVKVGQIASIAPMLTLTLGGMLMLKVLTCSIPHLVTVSFSTPVVVVLASFKATVTVLLFTPPTMFPKLSGVSSHAIWSGTTPLRFAVNVYVLLGQNGDVPLLFTITGFNTSWFTG